MPKEIHFLGWDKPVTDAVSRHLLNANTPLTRLDDVLIVTPTRESGRRLREKMAAGCREKNTALLGTRMVTPLFFIQSRANTAQPAGTALVRGAWLKTLLGLRRDDCPVLFPRGIPPANRPWAFATAKIIQQLRDDLSDGGLSIGAVLERHAADLQEPQRWQDLDKIEKLYLENLERTGYRDPCALKLAQAAAPAVPAGIRKIVIASVPDPARLALTALAELSKTVMVEILVMAPEGLRDHFDDWGRPLPAKWRERLIAIPAPEKNILLSANPAGQAQIVADLMRANEYALADTCIGVPDRAVIPCLQDKLAALGITAFDPADRPLKDHHLYQLVDAWRQLAQEASFQNSAAFLRTADVLHHLAQARGINPFELLAELDQIQNKILPRTMPDLEAALKKKGDFPNLKKAGKFINEITAAAQKEAPPEALRSFLEQIFASKTITGASAEDQDFKAAAAQITGVLNDLGYAREYLRDFPPQFINQLVISSLDELSIPRQREGAGLDLNGWLELAWHDAPLMIITGFNEGYVPDSQKSAVFLPDSLKKNLGLRDNETRFARDAYLLSLILATRARQGRVILTAGKTTPAGDPLKPSRLLFRCPDEQLAKRTGFIFQEIKEEIHRPPFAVTFKLDPTAPLANRAQPILPVELHATQFRDYLACPFRFYLKHILKMQRAGEKTELDALDFGTAIHVILDKFSGNPEINDSADAGAIQKYLDGLLAGYFKNIYGANDSFPILYARAIAAQRLKAFAEHQAQAVAAGWEIVNHELTGQLALAGIKVIGKIDRVDRNRRDGRWRIVDYKTADSAENPEKKHVRETRKETPDYAALPAAGKRWLDLQMPLYWHMFRETERAAKGQEIELCYFNLPRALSNAGTATWENFDETLARAARQSAEKIIKRVVDGIFWPPAATVEYDDFESLHNEDIREYFAGEKITDYFAGQGARNHNA